MSAQKRIRVAFFGLLVFLVAACVPAANPNPTLQAEAIYTAAAHTMEARQTLSAGETAVVLLTEIASRPSATPDILVVPTLLPTWTPASTATHQPGPTQTRTPVPTPLPGVCDAARLVADVTVPENTLMAAGTPFIKTWRLQNSGRCTWTPAYALVFAGGEAMNAPIVVGIPGTVLPGETVDLAVALKAPPSQGFYENRWLMRNAGNQYFPVTGQEQDSLWVRLEIIPLPTSGRYSFDFIAQACNARWSGSSGLLGCPGNSSDAAGSIQILGDPYLESRQENEPALWLRPAASRDGWIAGEYPSYRIVDGDRFVAEVGCLRDNPNCSLTFRLDYRGSNGTIWNLGLWDEIYDRNSTTISLDLSDLSGEVVQFIFTVSNRGRVSDANAFWFAPSIRNDYRNASQVLSWHQEGGLRNTCDELKIFLYNNQSAEARATSCKNGTAEVGRATLSSQELQQLLDWINRLSSFDGEVFSPAGGEPLISYIVLKGRGSAEAGSTDIQNMRSFAEKIYNQISQ